MKTILFVHQSADLYGSDRVLLALVTQLGKDEFHPIVLLPLEGPLLLKLRARGVECHIVPITRLSRATLSLRGMLTMPGSILKSLKAIDAIIKGRKVNLVHSNTLAVLSGALWAKLHCVSHVWHVHEIIVHPIWVRKIYAYLLTWLADWIICVSHATENNLLLDKPVLATKISVVWNGLEQPQASDNTSVSVYRQSIGMKEGELLVALVGRINRLKGQRLLVETAGLLWRQGIRNLKFLIVGSVVPGQEHFMRSLQSDIVASSASKCFILQPFTQQIETVWNACDIAVIPSTEPESFGMVALEAMAAGKPVVAANHGGLSEIVVQGGTGVLVDPGNVAALAEAIRNLAVSPADRDRMGQAGLMRYKAEFSLGRYLENIGKVYRVL
jgi:glycosyltransferase involved in cell wall biosynthesis